MCHRRVLQVPQRSVRCGLLQAVSNQLGYVVFRHDRGRYLFIRPWGSYLPDSHMGERQLRVRQLQHNSPAVMVELHQICDPAARDRRVGHANLDV